MNNNQHLGCVIYTETTIGILAEWVSKGNGKITQGNGIGRRLSDLNKKRRFEGTYEITYVDANGDKSPKLHLTISFEAGFYHLVWKDNQKTTDTGIGIENNNMLLVSYTKNP